MFDSDVAIFVLYYKYIVACNVYPNDVLHMYEYVYYTCMYFVVCNISNTR